MALWCGNFPTTEGKFDLGASSPETPALQEYDPLSITIGKPSSFIWSSNTSQFKVQGKKYLFFEKLASDIQILILPAKNWGKEIKRYLSFEEKLFSNSQIFEIIRT